MIAGIIERREAAAELVLSVAQTHKLEFVREMAKLLQIEPFSFQEPYLKSVLAMFVQQYLESLDGVELRFFAAE